MNTDFSSWEWGVAIKKPKMDVCRGETELTGFEENVSKTLGAPDL